LDVIGDRKEIDIMTAMTKVLLCSTVLVLPFTAVAQSDDAKYCHALSEAYRHGTSRKIYPPVEVPVAMAKCEEGDTAAGIPILEKALRDAKINLPPRG
jgi:hypothetical protein